MKEEINITNQANNQTEKVIPFDGLVRLRRKKYRLKNVEKIKEWKRRYYLKNRDKILLEEKQKRDEYRKYHKDKRLKNNKLTDDPNYYRDYTKKNKEHLRELAKEYYKNNRERLKERSFKYYKNNREKILSDGKNSTSAIKALIRGRGGILKHKDIPQELVDVKREQLKLRRLINERKNVE